MKVHGDGGRVGTSPRGLRARLWAEAYAQFAAADRETRLEQDDLVRLGTAAYLTGRDADSTMYLREGAVSPWVFGFGLAVWVTGGLVAAIAFCLAMGLVHRVREHNWPKSAVAISGLAVAMPLLVQIVFVEC